MGRKTKGRIARHRVSTYYLYDTKTIMMWLHYIGQRLLSRRKTNLGDLSNE